MYTFGAVFIEAMRISFLCNIATVALRASLIMPVVRFRHRAYRLLIIGLNFSHGKINSPKLMTSMPRWRVACSHNLCENLDVDGIL